jgi:hypothetical protein
MKITVDLEELPPATRVMVPQAELVKGAIGYVLLLQQEDKQYALHLPAVFKALNQPEPAVITPVE